MFGDIYDGVCTYVPNACAYVNIYTRYGNAKMLSVLVGTVASLQSFDGAGGGGSLDLAGVSLN